MTSTDDIEKALIGTLLRIPEYLPAILDRLHPRLFDGSAHRVVCRAMLSMSQEGVPLDLVSLWQFIHTKIPDHGLPGPSALHDMVEWGDPSKQRVNHYLDLLEEAALSRALRSAAAQVLTATEEAHDPRAVLTAFEAAVGEQLRTGHVQFQPSQEVIMASLDIVDMTYKGQLPPGIPTGLPLLDKFLGAWHRSDLVVIGGRPSMGKTAFLVHTMLHGARQGKHFALVSLEMSAFDLSLRLFGASNPVLVPESLRRGELTSMGWQKLTDTASQLSQLPISLLDTSALTLNNLSRYVQSLHVKHPIDCLVVDYIQLMEAERPTSSRQQELTDISKGLKRLAKRLNIPVLVAASLNRDCERRENKRPLMSDLRESGAIESDADIVFFLYRDEVYDPDTAEPGICELLIRKNRNGPTGELKVNFHGPSMTFS